MVKNQTIYLGIGSISLENDEQHQQLVVRHISPSEENKKEPAEPIQTISKVIFPYSQTFEKWANEIKQVNEQNRSVVKDGYTFDFSVCDSEAIRVVHARVLRGFHEWKWHQKKNRN